jgi:hypothetical protein
MQARYLFHVHCGARAAGPCHQKKFGIIEPIAFDTNNRFAP